jgi:hypothetical protein
MDTSDIITRIGELQIQVKAAELVPGTTSLLALVYGEESPQLASYAKQLEQLHKKPQVMSHVLDREIVECSQGALRNLKREIEGGLTGNLRQQITGEVLADLIQLSRTVIIEQGDGAKNVAAVLAAAAFEDAIRRMGKTFAGVIGQDDLSEVLKKLKDAGVMLGPQVGIAQSYLSFRNHALHANWDKIGKESIHSVLGFVEQLLLKHFS